MRIGIITFHWGTNYGALLQAFALNQFLYSAGYETEIINYIPLSVKTKKIMLKLKNLDLSELKKEYLFYIFKKKYLRMSKKKYYTNKSLVKRCNNYNIYITGSDQIWNESFTLHAENKTTLSYYLNFVKEENKRISYAASFGTNNLSKQVIEIVKPELEKFCDISVREKSGKKIIEQLNLNANLVVDPTLILDKCYFEEIINNEKIKKKFKIFTYILHKNQILAYDVRNYIYKKYFGSVASEMYDGEAISIAEWLYNIKNSEFILTNSFHGVVFSIIFNKLFIVVPVEKSSMNCRIETLLESIGLGYRIVKNNYKDTVDKIFRTKY